MGEAYDRTGAFLGAAEADSAREVLEKLQLKHREAAEFRIRTAEREQTTPAPQRPPDNIDQQIEAWFTYHQPVGNQPERYAALRGEAKKLAHVIAACCPPSADRTAALRLLRECVMTANASIALEPAAEPTPA